MGHGHCLKKGRRLDAEIKRTQNALLHIPVMTTSVKFIMIMKESQLERRRPDTVISLQLTWSHKNGTLEVHWGTGNEANLQDHHSMAGY